MQVLSNHHSMNSTFFTGGSTLETTSQLQGIKAAIKYTYYYMFIGALRRTCLGLGSAGKIASTYINRAVSVFNFGKAGAAGQGTMQVLQAWSYVRKT